MYLSFRRFCGVLRRCFLLLIAVADGAPSCTSPVQKCDITRRETLHDLTIKKNTRSSVGLYLRSTRLHLVSPHHTSPYYTSPHQPNPPTASPNMAPMSVPLLRPQAETPNCHRILNPSSAVIQPHLAHNFIPEEIAYPQTQRDNVANLHPSTHAPVFITRHGVIFNVQDADMFSAFPSFRHC